MRNCSYSCSIPSGVVGRAGSPVRALSSRSLSHFQSSGSSPLWAGPSATRSPTSVTGGALGSADGLSKLTGVSSAAGVEALTQVPVPATGRWRWAPIGAHFNSVSAPGRTLQPSAMPWCDPDEREGGCAYRAAQGDRCAVYRSHAPAGAGGRDAGSCRSGLAVLPSPAMRGRGNASPDQCPSASARDGPLSLDSEKRTLDRTNCSRDGPVRAAMDEGVRTAMVEAKGTWVLKKGLAQMLKGGVIMDVVTPEQALIAEEAGACAVMALERVPSDIRAQGGVARMSDPD